MTLKMLYVGHLVLVGDTEDVVCWLPCHVGDTEDVVCWQPCHGR